MLDVAWPELVVIGAVALVAIGPKDLPNVMRTLGRWIGQIRRLGTDLRSHMEQLSYEAEVAERLRKEAERPSTGRHSGESRDPAGSGCD